MRFSARDASVGSAVCGLVWVVGASLAWALLLRGTSLAAVPEARTAQTASPSPSPSPNTAREGGFFRSYYFTRQNASNNPGTRFDFSPGAKYNANGVNQASWNSAISISGDYFFTGGWSVGGSYLYANPMDGPCVVPIDHVKGAECVTQIPPRTNADDTLPGFALSTFYQAYLKYDAYRWKGTLGNQLFDTPWARPADSRLKPAAFEGGSVGYTTRGAVTFEAADMLAFEPRTSSDFIRQTLLTSFPAGNSGLPSNVDFPGGHGVDTNGFTYGRVGYAGAGGASMDGYFYGVSDLVDIWWFEGKYELKRLWGDPVVALQGGWENNNGAAYIGKIDSRNFGAQVKAFIAPHILFTAGYDSIPWRSDSVYLPKNVSCDHTNYQITTRGTTFGYFLPLNAAQCFTYPNGKTQVYYGGWASPYTDNYSNDEFFTTSTTQGMADRRAPGVSWKVGLKYTSPTEQWIVEATDAWYDYGNALAPESTNLWTLDGQYRFGDAKAKPYRGLLLRYRYIERTLSNTYCGAAATNCPPGSSTGSSFLGGLPMFKYNRAMLEYDF